MTLEWYWWLGLAMTCAMLAHDVREFWRNAAESTLVVSNAVSLFLEIFLIVMVLGHGRGLR